MHLKNKSWKQAAVLEALAIPWDPVPRVAVPRLLQCWCLLPGTSRDELTLPSSLLAFPLLQVAGSGIQRIGPAPARAGVWKCLQAGCDGLELSCSLDDGLFEWRAA